MPSATLLLVCEYLRDFGRNAVDDINARALALPDVSCRSDGTYEMVQCYDKYCWCVDEFGTEISGSRVLSSSKDKLDCDIMKRQKGCDGLLCRLGCDYGFEYGDDGCPICKCRSPCDVRILKKRQIIERNCSLLLILYVIIQSTPCPTNHQCQMVEVDCFGGFCPAVPQCNLSLAFLCILKEGQYPHT